jgi:hypothetical protein
MADEETGGDTPLPRKPNPAVVAAILERKMAESRERLSRALPHLKRRKDRYVARRRRRSSKRKAQ